MVWVKIDQGRVGLIFTPAIVASAAPEIRVPEEASLATIIAMEAMPRLAPAGHFEKSMKATCGQMGLSTVLGTFSRLLQRSPTTGHDHVPRAWFNELHPPSLGFGAS